MMIYRTMKAGQLTQTAVDAPAFDLTYDVCVVGLGTAGAMAALAAAEAGATVFGIDFGQAPGGIAVCGGVQSYYFGAPGGRWEQIHTECRNYIDAGIFSPTCEEHFEKRSHTGSVKGFVLEQNLLAAKVTLSYDSILLGVYTEGNTVVGIRFLNSHGVQRTVQAKLCIDGAEGILARLAGASFQRKRASDGISMPASVFQLEGKPQGVDNKWGRSRMMDDLPTDELSRQLLQIYAGAPYLRREPLSYPIVEVGSLVGRREMYCIDSEENMSLSDYFAGQRTQAPAFYAFSCTDNSAHDMVAEDEALANWMFLAGINGHGFSIPVPYKAMIPKGVNGLLVTGKVIGSGHEAVSCVRMKADMEKCGEAAGVLAALAVKQNCDVRAVPYTDLAERLTASGCLDPQWDVGFCDLRIRTEKLWQPLPLPKTEQELAQAFASEHPEVGLASAVYREVPNEVFYALLRNKRQQIREHAAIALGIRGEYRIIPFLILILGRTPQWEISFTDANTFDWLCVTHHCNYLKAVLLIGRFGYKPLLPRLEADLARLEEILPPPCEHSPSLEETRTLFHRFLSYTIEKLKALE